MEYACMWARLPTNSPNLETRILPAILSYLSLSLSRSLSWILLFYMLFVCCCCWRRRRRPSFRYGFPVQLFWHPWLDVKEWNAYVSDYLSCGIWWHGQRYFAIGMSWPRQWSIRIIIPFTRMMPQRLLSLFSSGFTSVIEWTGSRCNT